jgi:hypothetical protein
MAKRWIVLLFISVFLISLVSGAAKIGEPYNITVSCSNIDCTNTNITVLFPNKTTTVVSNTPLISYTSYATFQIIPTAFGEYTVYLSNGTLNYELTFEASSTGFTLSTGSSIFYAVLIFLMIILLVGTVYGTGKLPSASDKDEEGRIMSVKWLKYLRAPLYFVAWMLFIAILYISSNLAFAYLGEQLFAQILFVLFRITFGVTPLIVIIWVVWFFVKFFEDKKFQNLLNRGLYPQTRRL